MNHEILPPWFTEAWVLVVKPRPRSGVRYITYWTRAKYERMIVQWRSAKAQVLYGIHVKRRTP